MSASGEVEEWAAAQRSGADAALARLARDGALHKASTAITLGDLIADASDYPTLVATNATNLLFSLAEAAFEAEELLESRLDDPRLRAALHRVYMLERNCPPISRRFVERVRAREPLAMLTLTRWAEDDDR